MTRIRQYREVVINTCFGGFGLSKKAVAELARLRGRKAYFFTTAPGSLNEYIPVDEASKDSLFWTAFDIPNPNEVLRGYRDWHDMTDVEKQASNKVYEQHALPTRPDDRADPLLVKVVKQLGQHANGGCADLKIVKIPAEVKYVIEEYDGLEHIAEVHRTWR